MSERGIGDNSVAAGELKQYIERIERLADEKEALSDDIKEVFVEAKGVGYDVATMRRVLKIRRMDRDRRRVEEEMLSVYLRSLGME
jgi:uncharacterized protein (UPF0335 family)